MARAADRSGVSRLIRAAAIGAVAAVALAVLAGLAAFAALQMRPVRAALVDWAVAQVVVEVVEREAIAVDVAGFDGVWPFTPGIARLTIRDGDTAIARAEGVRLRWSPLALIAGTVRIDDLSAARIEILTWPETEPAADTAAAGPVLPRLPVDVVLERLHLPEIDLAPGVAGPDALRLAASASGALTGDTARLEIAASRRDAAPFMLDVAVSYAPDADDVRLDLKLIDGSDGAPGVVAALTGDRALSPLRATASSSGPAAAWSGALDVSAGDYGTLAASAQGSWVRGGLLEIAATARPGPALGEMPSPVTLHADAGRTGNGMAAPRLELQVGGLRYAGRLALADPFAAPAVSLAGQVSGLAAALGIDGLPDRVVLAVDAAVDAALTTVTVDRFEAVADGQRLAFAGSVALDERTLSGIAEAELGDVTPLAALAGLDAGGALQASADIARAGWDGTVTASVDAMWQPLALADPRLEDLLGGGLALSVSLAAAGDGVTRIETLTLTPVSGAFAFALLGDGRVSRAAMDVSVALDMPDLAAFSPLAGVALAGSAQAQATIAGPVSALAADVSASLPDVRVDDTEVAGSLTARLSLMPAPAGPVRFEGRIAGAPARLAFDLATPPGGGLRAEGLDLAMLGLEATGTAAVGPAGAADLALTGRVTDLAPLGRLAGLDAAGSGSFRVEASAGGGAAAQVAAQVALPGMRVGALAAQDFSADLSLTASQTLAATIALRGVDTGTVTAGEVTLTAKGPLGAVALAATADAIGLGGEMAATGRVTAAGVLDVSGRRGELSSLEGRLADETFALSAPMPISLADGIEAGPFEMAAGAGTLAGRLVRAGSRLDARLTLTEVPLRLVAAPWDSDGLLAGSLAGDLRIEGRDRTGSGAVSLRIAPRLTGGALDEVPDFDISAEWDGTIALARLTMNAKGAEDLALDIRLPLTARAGLPALPPQPTIEARAHGRGDLGLIWPLLPVDTHRLAGTFDVDLTASGPLADPAVAGRVRVTDGIYENTVLGLLLSPLDVEAEVARDTGRVQVRGGDGGRGTLSGSGQVNLASGSREPRLQVGLDIANFTVARRDEVTATASGSLMAVWPAAHQADAMATLSGRIVVDSLEASIPDQLAADVETIEVTRVSVDGVPLDPPQAARDGESPRAPIALDLTIDVPGKAFVRGRGLDSEWRGNARVTGTMAAPIVEGRFSIVRGGFDLLGRRFDLETGTVTFTGGREIDPLLNLRAVFTRDDFTAIFQVTGSASRPDIEITSSPEYPRDEVLARVLFGTGTGQLSALQALELADAAATLSGRGGIGVGGIVDTMRRTLGLDVLAVRDAGVELGSYVTEGIYVGVTQGFEADSSEIEVDVELTGDLALEGTHTPGEGSDIGIVWRRDY